VLRVTEAVPDSKFLSLGQARRVNESAAILEKKLGFSVALSASCMASSVVDGPGGGGSSQRTWRRGWPLSGVKMLRRPGLITSNNGSEAVAAQETLGLMLERGEHRGYIEWWTRERGCAQGDKVSASP